MPEPGPVIFEEVDAANGKAIGVITLSVEKTLNSLTLPMVDLMLAQLQDWQHDDRIAAVWLQGTGEKAFCAGGDVQELYRSATKTPGGPCVEAETFFEREYRLDYLLHIYPKPVVCWGDGIVMGGGLGLFMGCSHAIVTEKTRIAMPEITIALYPDVGGTWFLNRMPGKTGLFVALTAASINAADVLYAGMARYFALRARKAEVFDLVKGLDWKADDAANKNLLTEALKSHTAARATQEDGGELVSAIAEHRELIDRVCSGSDLETVVNNILAMESDDTWLEKAKASLAHGSTITAHNIWQQLKRGEALSLEEVFQFELMLSTTVVRHPEFAEGVRALLIDKDKNPKWTYPSVEEVPAELIEHFFTPPWPQNPLADIAELKRA